jgi:hypothetical protein
MAAKKQQAEEQRTEDQPEQQQDEAQPEKLDRTEAANKVIAEMDGEASLTELTEKADALFVAGGGKSNFDRQNWEVWRSVQTAEALGLVETEEGDIIVRKVKK